MKKLLMLFCMSIILTGCSDKVDEPKPNVSENINDNYYPLIITDATNKEIVIEEEPQTIISLIPSNTEIAYSLGLGDKIIGVSGYDNYPEDVLTKEKVTGLDVNVELIVSLNPDLVLTHESGINASLSSLEQIEQAGIDVVVVDDAQTFEEVYDTIYFVGEITNKNNEAKEVVNGMKQHLKEIQEKIAPYEKEVTVYTEVSPEPSIFTVGKKTFIDEALNYLNVTNVFDEEGWLAIDSESVVLKNPDYIFTTYGYYIDNPIQVIKSRAGWQDMTAIINDHVYDLDSDKVSRPGPRLIEGVEEFAKAIYPEAFKE